MKGRSIFWIVAVAVGALPLLTLAFVSRPNEAAGPSYVAPGGSASNGEAAPGEKITFANPLTASTVYLPALFKPQPGIQGYVTFNGAPAAGVFLELRLFNGQSFSTQASGNTDVNGFYDLQAASLTAGQWYYVRYLNPGGMPDHLRSWFTVPINTYSFPDSLGAGNFDLGDVALVAPDNFATVSLPAHFQWVRRAATPSDSYQLTVNDPNGPPFWQSGPLGYVNEITVSSVTGGFQSGTAYDWWVEVDGPDGGYGRPYARKVTFTNISASSQPVVAGGATVGPASAPVDRPSR